MKKYLAVITAAVFLTSAMFTGCSKKAADNVETKKTTIKFATFYKDKEQADTYSDMVKEFETANTDVKVELVSDFTDEKKLNETVTKSGEYDLVGLNRNQLLDYAKSGFLEDLSSFSVEKEFNNKLYKISNAYGSYNGKQYGAGDMPMTIEWFYNPDIFKQYGLSEPKDLKELKLVCEKLKNNGLIPISVGAMDSFTLTSLFGMITAQTTGAEKLSANFDADSKAFEEIKGLNEAYKIFSKLIGSCIPTNSLDINYKQSVDDFIKGKSAILPAGSWVVDLIEKTKPANFNYQTFKTPVKFAEKPMNEISATAGQILAIPANAKNKDAAKRFLEFVFSDKAQKFFTDAGYISSLKLANTNSNSVKGSVLSHLEKADKESVMLIENSKPQITEAFGSVLTDMMSGVISGDEAFKRTIKIAFHK